MKLTFFDDFIPGIVSDDQIFDINHLIPLPPACPPQARMEWLIENWPTQKSRITDHLSGAAGRAISEVRLRPPLPRPSKILCAAANYLEGIPDNISELEFFHKSSTAIIGDKDTMVLPDADITIVHHELELAVVIGQRCSHVSEAEAMDYVFGYTILQDGSARGILINKFPSFFTQKNWDTFAPLGPVILTKDEVSDPHNLQVRLWANGELRQDYNTSDMAHRIPRLIQEASRFNTLLPGDIIATGTNRQGLGPMQHGDTFVQEIAGIGQLTTYVTDPRNRQWPHGIDVEFAEYVRTPRAKRGMPKPPRIVPVSEARAMAAAAADTPR